MPPSAFAPLRLVIGDEEFLVAREVAAVAAAARRADPHADVRDQRAGELTAGQLLDLLSPALFGGRQVVIVRDTQEATKEVAAALLAYARRPAEQIVLLLTHGGGARGKALLDGVKQAGAAVVLCPRLKPSERHRFVRDEIGAAGGTVTEDAAHELLAAVGTDLRELAAACAQLVADTGGKIDSAAVARYYRGRAEVTGFTVADSVLAGNIGAALEALRWALSLGVDPVPIADALADGVRTVSRVAATRGTNAYTVAASLKMPPWKVERALRQARGWTPQGLSDAMRVAADLNADVKGNAEDPVFALERAVLRISGRHGRRGSA